MVTHQSGWKPISEAASAPQAGRQDIDEVLGAGSESVRDEAGLMQRVIDFANGETDTRRMKARIAFSLAMDTGWFPSTDAKGRIDDTGADADIARLADPATVHARVQADRENARKVLRAAANEPDLLVEWINDYRARHGDGFGVIRRPSLQVDTRGRAKISWTLGIDEWANGISAALAYTAALLLSDQDQCRSDLGFCRLEECGRFFVVERGKPGKPRRDYCCTEHMTTAHERDSARRHREARERRKAEAAKPRRRRST